MMIARWPRTSRPSWLYVTGTILLTLVLAAQVSAQNVGALRASPYDLPANDIDREVLNVFFGDLGAVQTACAESLTASLAEEIALAACATFRPSSLSQRVVDTAFMMATDVEKIASFETPWSENADFGIVRWLRYRDQRYVLTLDLQAGVARVVRFLE